MARSPQVQKDKSRRKHFHRFENNYRLWKSQALSLHLPLEVRENAKEKLAKLNSKGFLTRIKNRCTLTGKSRGVIRKFGLSQTSLRMVARTGLVTGMKKSSWLLVF